MSKPPRHFRHKVGEETQDIAAAMETGRKPHVTGLLHVANIFRVLACAKRHIQPPLELHE